MRSRTTLLLCVPAPLKCARHRLNLVRRRQLPNVLEIEGALVATLEQRREPAEGDLAENACTEFGARVLGVAADAHAVLFRW